MSKTPGYASPAAFRRALTDKLKASANDSRWTLAQLQRQLAYDRLLERLYLEDQGWIVKGATALLARDLGVRATIDIDVFREAPREVAVAELRAAAARDVGDWFRFEVGGARAVADSAAGVRLPVTAYIGATPWATFHVDIIGTDIQMTGEPEEVPALARVAMPHIEQRGYRAYPLVDHIADKVVATFDRYGETAAPSTRYKDLVDLVAIVLDASANAAAQMAALNSEAERRGISSLTISKCPIAICGNAATQPRPAGHCCASVEHCSRHSTSCDRSWTHSSAEPRPDGGTPPRVAGHPDRKRADCRAGDDKKRLYIASRQRSGGPGHQSKGAVNATARHAPDARRRQRKK